MQAQAILWSSTALGYDGTPVLLWSPGFGHELGPCRALQGKGRFVGNTERHLSLQETLQPVHSAQLSFS